jgi:hypothetical protein
MVNSVSWNLMLLDINRLKMDFKKRMKIESPRTHCFAELSRLGGIGSPLLAAESASIKNLP